MMSVLSIIFVNGEKESKTTTLFEKPHSVNSTANKCIGSTSRTKEKKLIRPRLYNTHT